MRMCMGFRRAYEHGRSVVQAKRLEIAGDGRASR